MNSYRLTEGNPDYPVDRDVSIDCCVSKWYAIRLLTQLSEAILKAEENKTDTIRFNIAGDFQKWEDVK